MREQDGTKGRVPTEPIAFAGFWLKNKARKDLRFLKQAVVDTFRRPAPPPEESTIPAVADPDTFSITWLGHATVLIDFYGIRLLTDPVLYDRVGPSLGPITLGPKRYVRAPVTPLELGSVDLVLITHAHLDHLDRHTLKALPPPRHAVTAINTSDLLPGNLAGRSAESAWWTTRTFECGERSIALTAFPVRHPGARWRRDTHRTCNAYMLERAGWRVAFVGDSAFDPRFITVRERLGAVDLAIIPIGAYDPFVWNHATPEQAVNMAQLLGASRIMPIHHGTFKLSQEPLDEPLTRFRAEMERRRLQALSPPVGRSQLFVRDTRSVPHSPLVRAGMSEAGSV